MKQKYTVLRTTAIAIAALLLVACGVQPVKKEHDSVFYPALPQQPRVQYLTTINTQGDLGSKKGMDSFLGDPENVRNRLLRAYAVAHEKDFIYVVDAKFKKIVTIDLKKGTMGFFPSQRMGLLREPMGIFVDADGSKYVADNGRGQVVVYNSKNEYLRTYGTPEQYKLTDVAVHGERVYIANNQAHEIVVLDKTSGEVVQRIGSKGTEDGKFRFPSFITVDKDGNLFVTDPLNFRVQMFSSSGEFIRSFGYPEAGPGGMVRPKSLAVTRDGKLYISDAGMEIVQIFDVASTDPLLAFGKHGTGPGSTYMPYGIHIDYDNVAHFAQYADPEFKPEFLIYVVNHAGDDKLNVYAFGEWTGAKQ